MSTGVWLQYLEYLRLALSELEQVRREYVALSTKHPKTVFSDPSNADLFENWRRMAYVSTLLHMRIETFFYYAKVLTDRVADTVREYFGLPRQTFGSSHSKLIERIDRLGVRVPRSTAALANEVKTRVVDVKTRIFEHFAEARTIRTPIVDGSGAVKMIIGMGLPGPSGEAAPSIGHQVADDPKQLLDVIERYIGEMTRLMKSNVSKSMLKRAPSRRGSDGQTR
jgi:hypothetical protein